MTVQITNMNLSQSLISSLNRMAIQFASSHPIQEMYLTMVYNDLIAQGFHCKNVVYHDNTTIIGKDYSAKIFFQNEDNAELSFMVNMAEIRLGFIRDNKTGKFRSTLRH